MQISDSAETHRALTQRHRMSAEAVGSEAVNQTVSRRLGSVNTLTISGAEGRVFMTEQHLGFPYEANIVV